MQSEKEKGFQHLQRSINSQKERNNGENKKDFYLYSLYSYSAAFEEGRIVYSNKNILREMNCHRNKHFFILIYIKITKGIN